MPIGQVAWNKGKPWSKKTKEKMSKARMGKEPWNKNKKGVMPIPWNKGTHGLVKSWNKNKKTGFTPWLGKKRPNISGKNHWRWKGGKIYMAGYVYILKPNHPRADKRGYIKRAYLVVEKTIKRYINFKEIVHHINGIKNDDRPENLQLFPNRSEHTKHHHKITLSQLLL